MARIRPSVSVKPRSSSVTAERWPGRLANRPALTLDLSAQRLLGAFLAVLDIRSNSSLKDIQGALAATLEKARGSHLSGGGSHHDPDDRLLVAAAPRRLAVK